MDWKEHFSEFPARFEETDFLRQVAKTVCGLPITPAQFEGVVSDICGGLRLEGDDSLLDLCCGNGVVTTRLSRRCRRVVGVDFSEPLIRIASRHHRPGNVEYHCLSVLDERILDLARPPFSKVLMYEALQHFPEEDLPRLVEVLSRVAGRTAVIFLGSVPDADRLWDFYDTEERRRDYRDRVSRGEEAIGTWWRRERIAEVCRAGGFACEFLAQDPVLHSAHYRFDLRLTRPESPPGPG